MEQPPQTVQCTFCAKECDPAADFHALLDCSVPSCGRSVYHTECLRQHLRRTRQGVDRMAGYLCLVGRGRELGGGREACNGHICATYRRAPASQKQQPAGAAGKPAAKKAAPARPRAKQPPKQARPAAAPAAAGPAAAGQGVAARMSLPPVDATVVVPGMDAGEGAGSRRRSARRGRKDEPLPPPPRGAWLRTSTICDVDTYNAVLASCGVPRSVIFDEDADADAAEEERRPLPLPLLSPVRAEEDDCIRFPTEDELFELLGYTF